MEFALVKFQPEALKEKLVIPPRDTGLAYVDFLRVLTRPTVREDYLDVGVFAGSKLNPKVYGYQMHLDADIGCLIWFLLFLLGFKLQKVKKNKEENALKQPLTEGETA